MAADDRCEHAECDEPTEGNRRFCLNHEEQLRLMLATLTPRCDSCGNLVTEGFLHHDCTHPAPQPPSEEL